MSHRGRTPYSEQIVDLLDEVKGRPDEWANVGTFPGKDAAHKVARELAEKLQSPKWEFDPRRLDNGSTLYVKYHSDARRRRNVA